MRWLKPNAREAYCRQCIPQPRELELVSLDSTFSRTPAEALPPRQALYDRDLLPAALLSVQQKAHARAHDDGGAADAGGRDGLVEDGRLPSRCRSVLGDLLLARACQCKCT